MFHEFTLRPDAKGKVILNTFLQGSVYFVSILFIYLWLRFLEPAVLKHYGFYVGYVFGFVALATVILMFRLYTTGIKFRMLTSDTDLQFTRLGNSITVKYSDITRLERTPNNILLIYTVSSDTKPVIAVSDTITDRSRFEEILSQFTPITEIDSIPRAFKKVPRMLFTYTFMTAVFLNLISRNPNTQIGAALIVIGLSVYSLISFMRFRHEIKSTNGVVIMILLILIMLVRIFLALQPELFPNPVV